MVKRGVHVSGTSPESISSLLSEVAECGTHYTRLSHFSLQPVLNASCSKGLVFQVGLPSREVCSPPRALCTGVGTGPQGCPHQSPCLLSRLEPDGHPSRTGVSPASLYWEPGIVGGGCGPHLGAWAGPGGVGGPRLLFPIGSLVHLMRSTQWISLIWRVEFQELGLDQVSLKAFQLPLRWVQPPGQQCSSMGGTGIQRSGAFWEH